MTRINKLKEKYNKYSIIIAIISFCLGLIVIVISPTILNCIIGGAFIQLGISILVVDMIISKIGSKILIEQIMKGFRYVLGIDDPNNKLFPELIRLIRPHPYHVLGLTISNELFYDENKKNKPFNLGIKETVESIVQAKEDNVHYHFFRETSDSENSLDSLKEIRINGNLLTRKDLISEKDESGKVVKYIVQHPLKAGQTYKFEMKFLHSGCMSDLNQGGLKEDFMKCKFIELTNKAEISFKFPFNILCLFRIFNESLICIIYPLCQRRKPYFEIQILELIN